MIAQRGNTTAGLSGDVHKAPIRYPEQVNDLKLFEALKPCPCPGEVAQVHTTGDYLKRSTPAQYQAAVAHLIR